MVDWAVGQVAQPGSGAARPPHQSLLGFVLNIIKINKNYRSTHKPEVSVNRKWGNLLAEAGRFRWVRFAAAG